MFLAVANVPENVRCSLFNLSYQFSKMSLLFLRVTSVSLSRAPFFLPLSLYLRLIKPYHPPSLKEVKSEIGRFVRSIKVVLTSSHDQHFFLPISPGKQQKRQCAQYFCLLCSVKICQFIQALEARARPYC